MISRQGKLFRSNISNSVECIEYDASQNYYAFIQNNQSNGYNQCIVTSDIMIDILQHFILNGKVEVTSIEFMVEDEDLETEIHSILEHMKQNFGYWEILKQKISFLSQNDSIELKKVSFRKLTEGGALFSIQVNGLIVVSENEYNNITKEISSIVGGCIK